MKVIEVYEWVEDHFYGVILSLDADTPSDKSVQWVKNTNGSNQIYKIVENQELEITIESATAEDFSVGDILKPFNQYRAVSDETYGKAGRK